MNNFPTENLKSIRIISATLSQPIAIACYTQEDEELVAGLESIIKQNGYTCADVATWCKDKGLLFSTYQTPAGRSDKFQQVFYSSSTGIAMEIVIQDIQGKYEKRIYQLQLRLKADKRIPQALFHQKLENGYSLEQPSQVEI